MNIGAHVPMHNSEVSALELDADVVQIQLGSPRQWNQTKAARSPAPRLYVHSPYLLNFSAANRQQLNNSVKLLGQQGLEAHRIQAKGLVVHGGSWKGHERRHAVAQWHGVLSHYHDFWPIILIENAASGKYSLTRHLEDLEELWRHIGEYNVGFCLDTAHLWANVHKRPYEEAENFIEGVKEITGGIQLVHANGSGAEIGSGRDIHAPFSESLSEPEWVVHCIQLAKPDDVIVESKAPKADIKVLRDLFKVV